MLERNTNSADRQSNMLCGLTSKHRLGRAAHPASTLLRVRCPWENIDAANRRSRCVGRPRRIATASGDRYQPRTQVTIRVSLRSRAKQETKSCDGCCHVTAVSAGLRYDGVTPMSRESCPAPLRFTNRVFSLRFALAHDWRKPEIIFNLHGGSLQERIVTRGNKRKPGGCQRGGSDGVIQPLHRRTQWPLRLTDESGSE